MKLINSKIYLVLFCTILFSSCTQDDDGIYFDDEISNIEISYTELEYEILNLINEHRVNSGLNTLNTLNIVSLEAAPHTDYMLRQGEASHDNFNIRHSNLINNANADLVAENVAYGFSSAKSVVNAWLKSNSHKTVIENSEFTDFGISTKSNSEGKIYFTHIFIKR